MKQDDDEDEGWKQDADEWMSPSGSPGSNFATPVSGNRSADGYPLSLTGAPPLTLDEANTARENPLEKNSPQSPGSPAREEPYQAGRAIRRGIGKQTARGKVQRSSSVENTDGTVSRGGRVGQTNCWTPAPTQLFPIRGKKYLSDGKKEKTEESTFELVGIDTITVDRTWDHVAEWEDSVFQRYRRNCIREGRRCPRFLILNWLAPANPLINHVQYFVERDLGVPSTPDEVMYKKMVDHFLEGPNDNFRKSRLKLIPNVVEGPWVVKQAAGSPALIGKKLTTVCHRGEGYCEISIDVGSSTIAARVLDLCKGACKSLVIDMAYCIEGKKEEELPERLLGACRLHYIDMSNLPVGPELPINDETAEVTKVPSEGTSASPSASEDVEEPVEKAVQEAGPGSRFDDV